MAITIYQNLDTYQPVYNPMRFVIGSSNTAQSNFKYVVDVYVSGVTGYTRLTYPADPTYGRAYPDVSRVLENYVSYDVPVPTEGDFKQCPNSIIAYEIKFGEQYGPTSGIVTYPDLTVTGTKYAWNGVINPTSFVNFFSDDYTITGSGEFLTNRNANGYNYTVNDDDWLYFINDTSGTAYYGWVTVYDIDGNELSRAKITNNHQASSSTASKLLRFPCGNVNIQNSGFITLVSGDPALTSATGAAYYDIFLSNYSGMATSSTYRFWYGCTSFKGQSPINVYWLNRLGGFDCFNFTKNRTKSSSIKRDTYQKNIGTPDSTTWTTAFKDRETTVFNTEITDGYIVESDWIDDTDSIWLQELVESPEVYVKESNVLIPMVQNLTKYDRKTIAVERLFNLKIDLSYSKKRATQRG